MSPTQRRLLRLPDDDRQWVISILCATMHLPVSTTMTLLEKAPVKVSGHTIRVWRDFLRDTMTIQQRMEAAHAFIALLPSFKIRGLEEPPSGGTLPNPQA